MKRQHECVLRPAGARPDLPNPGHRRKCDRRRFLDLERHEMVAIGPALTQALIDISDRLGWLDTFGPGRGRVA